MRSWNHNWNTRKKSSYNYPHILFVANTEWTDLEFTHLYAYKRRNDQLAYLYERLYTFLKKVFILRIENDSAQTRRSEVQNARYLRLLKRPDRRCLHVLKAVSQNIADEGSAIFYMKS